MIKGNTWQPILRGAKITGFLLAIVLTSSIITIQSSRPAKAESLLYTVGCVVRGLLLKECPPKTTPPSQPTQPTSTPDPDPDNGGSTNSPSNDGGSGSSQNSNNATPQPLNIDEKPLGKLPSIRELTSSYPGVGAGYAANVLPSIRANEQQQAVLGASDAAPVQTTDQGWRILGVLWYWWLVAIGAIVVLGFIVKVTLLRSLFPVAKQQ